jgi:hypothetical protein
MNFCSSFVSSLQTFIQSSGNSIDSIPEVSQKQLNMNKDIENQKAVEIEALSEFEAENRLTEEEQYQHKKEELLTSEFIEEMDINCQFCDENHIATFKCIDCNGILMCEFMSISHSKGKLTKSHRIEKLSQLLTASSTQNVAKSTDNGSPTKKDTVSTNPTTSLPPESLATILCPQHNDVYRYHDHDCGIVICRDCYALLHNGHKCISIAEAAADFHSSLTTVCHDMKETTNALCTAETLVVEISDKLDARYSELNGQINKEFKEVLLDFPFSFESFLLFLCRGSCVSFLFLSFYSRCFLFIFLSGASGSCSYSCSCSCSCCYSFSFSFITY